MDLQDIRNLQEAYLEVYSELDEGKVEWDNPKRPLQSGWTPREKNRARRIKTGVENPDKPSFQQGGPSERDYERYGKLKAAHDEQKGKKVPSGKRHKFRKSSFSGMSRGQERRSHKQDKEVLSQQKQLKEPKEPKESYDIYDIIFSHLLDEGYAETPEAAKAIIVNMSEEWRNSIID